MNEQDKPNTFSPMTEAKLALIKAEATAEVVQLGDLDDEMRDHIKTIIYFIKSAATELEKY